MECWPPATSDECRPPSMCTMAGKIMREVVGLIVGEQAAGGCGCRGELATILLELIEPREVRGRGDDADFDVAGPG